jgi:hypothetical protein
MIGIRSAEVALLRRRLRVSESRERMLPADIIASVTTHNLTVAPRQGWPVADAPHPHRMTAAEVRTWLLARGVRVTLGSELSPPPPKPASK